MKQKIFALFLILCGLCLNLKAETQGDIVGRVLDDSGAPLVGATVQILHAKGGVTTDEDGYFRIPKWCNDLDTVSTVTSVKL